MILFSPVRQPAYLLREALISFHALKGVREWWYYDDNDDSESSRLLAEQPGARVLSAASLPPKEPYAKSQSHLWTATLMGRIAQIRNLAIVEFLKTDAEALFMIDSDVLPNPSLAQHLASLAVPIVSAVYWTQWHPNQAWLPNVWDIHNYQFKTPESLLRLAEPGVYQVGGLGAVTLMRREALATGVNYSPVAGLPWPGEDRHFSVRAAARGIGLYADSRFLPFHVYRDNQLDEAVAWRKAGCDPAYFRKRWLSNGWRRTIQAGRL